MSIARCKTCFHNKDLHFQDGPCLRSSCDCAAFSVARSLDAMATFVKPARLDAPLKNDGSKPGTMYEVVSSGAGMDPVYHLGTPTRRVFKTIRGAHDRSRDAGVMRCFCEECSCKRPAEADVCVPCAAGQHSRDCRGRRGKSAAWIRARNRAIGGEVGAGVPHPRIARRYGISQTLVWQIARKRSYANGKAADAQGVDRREAALVDEAVFIDEEAATAYFSRCRWLDGPVCPRERCGSRHIVAIGNRVGMRRCVVCEKQFSVRNGTIFEGSKLTMAQWLRVLYEVQANPSVTVSAISLAIGATYRTSWRALRRLRLAERVACADDPAAAGAGRLSA